MELIMELQLLPSLLLLISFLLLLVALKRSFSKSKARVAAWELPPGPWKLPFIGSSHHLLTSLPHHALRDLARTYGPVMLIRLGQVDLTVVSSREAAQEVLKTQDINFAYRPQLTAAKIVCYGCTDIAFSNGDYWRQLRKICVMELLSAKRVKSFASIRSKEISHLLRDIAATPDKPVNLREKLLALANDIVTQASFGQRCSDQLEFVATMKKAIELGSGFNVADFFPSLKFVHAISGFSSKLEKIHRQLDKILDATIKEHQLSRKEDEEAEDLIDVLLKLKDQGNYEMPITLENIKAVLVDLFTGGTETSSTTTEWVMSELIRHPRAMEKAQEEVREAAKGRATLEESDIAELNYIKLVVKETLRLHAPVPLLLPRVCQDTCQLLDYKIPAGTRVFINAWALGRDPQYWNDADSFKPERFEGDGRDYKGLDFEFLPFGSGRRMCPGLSFALATVELALAQLLFYFDWKLPNGMKPQDLDMTEAFGATSVRKSELHLVASPRYPLPAA